MALSGSQKMLLLLVLAFACLSSSGAEAWSWSWSNGSGWGWGSDGSSSSSPAPGPGSNSDRPGWNWGSRPGWGWSWGSSPCWGWNWGSSPGSPGSNNSGLGSSSNSSSSGSVRKIVLGGSEGWTKGLDYKEWARKNAPFYIDDVLVFKYDKHAKQRNNVYLFQDPWTYVNCDLKNAKKIGSTNTGSEESFKFTLKNKHPYFFASGEHDGAYCKHNMKFTVFPVRHRSD